MKLFRCLCLLALLPMASAACHGQAVPAAVLGVHLSAGVEGAGWATYYQTTRAYGAGGYADLDTRYLGIGAEGEIRFIRFHQAPGETQDTYLAGPKVSFFHIPRVKPYLKALVGDGQMVYPNDIGHGSYFVMEGGAGVDVRLTKHLLARGEYDGQIWPSAPAFPGVANSESLKPNGAVFGLAWRFF